MSGKDPWSQVLRLVVLLGCWLVAVPAARAVEPGVVPDLTWNTSHSDQDRTAQLLEEVGSRWVRLHVSWRDAEPSHGSFNSWWMSEYEGAIARAREHGQRVAVMVAQSPKWASGADDAYRAPRNNADFASFVRRLAARFKGKGVEAYEIWNEPNVQRFWPAGPNAAQYVALLRAAYPAVKAADPAAKVVFGGVSLNDYDFVAQAYAAGAKGSFDVMATHPYGCGSPELIRRRPDRRMTHDSFLSYREIRAEMLANHDDKPMWFTELGWSTASEGCGVDENTQATYLVKAFNLAAQDRYVHVAYWYNFRNNFWSQDQNRLEDRFGLIRSDFSAKPSYYTFRSFAQGERILVVPREENPQLANRGGRGGGTRLQIAVRRATRRGAVTVRGRILDVASGRVRVVVERLGAGRPRAVRRRTVRVRRGRFRTTLSGLVRGRRYQVVITLLGAKGSAAAVKGFRA